MIHLPGKIDLQTRLVYGWDNTRFWLPNGDNSLDSLVQEFARGFTITPEGSALHARYQPDKVILRPTIKTGKVHYGITKPNSFERVFNGHEGNYLLFKNENRGVMIQLYRFPPTHLKVV